MSDEPSGAPRIEFPCLYPIKVIGDAGEGFADMVLVIAERHAPGSDTQVLEVIDSKNGRFLSVRLQIIATGAEQLEALHVDLKATGKVHMVL